MKRGTRTLLVTLLPITLSAGCRDVTAPASAPARRVGSMETGAKPSAAAMPCNVSVRSTNGAGWGTYHTIVTFPARALSPENRTTIYFVRGYNDRSEAIAVAACVIPATPSAIRWIGKAFKVGKVEHAVDSRAAGVAIMAGETYELAPVVATACGPGYTGDYPFCVPVREAETTPAGYGGPWEPGGSGSSGSGTGPDSASAPDGYDTDPPEEDEATNCPTVLSGKVITAGVPVAGSLHTFEFDGPMTRISGPRSPAKYEISHPTVSEDSWWIAEAGWIAVNCVGVYSPNAFGYRLWIGTASYAGQSDLHMVLGPNHP